MSTATVHVVVPEGVDDPTRPSGGNAYDRRLCEELASSGWTVREHRAAGSPATALAGLPGGSLVLLDGLVGLPPGPALLEEMSRLRTVVLLHLPFAERDPAVRADERRLLDAAAAVVTTSRWSRRWVVDHHAPQAGVHVAEPGVAAAGPVPGSPAGDRLLCVAAVTPDKGHATLLDALARVLDLPWSLTCAGALDLDRHLAARLQRCAVGLGLGDRVTWTGPLVGAPLERAWEEADLLVLPTVAESWGMVVSEALARGLPVVATDVGGLPEALGTVAGGRRPGLLVPVTDPGALARALRRWLTDAPLRARLRAAAGERRTTQHGWPVTADRVARVLTEVSR